MIFLIVKTKLIKETTYEDTWTVRDAVIKNYDEYLKSDEWKNLKKELKKEKKYQTCRACGNKRFIQLHHKTYRWINTNKERLGIVALCGKCHRRTHEYAKKKNISIYRATKHIIATTKKRIR